MIPEHPLTMHPVGMLITGLFIFAWFILGIYTAPFVFSKFSRATAGYVSWLVETFDRMFMTVSARACVLGILVSMVTMMGLGIWLTTGLPPGPGYAVLRFFICFALAIGGALGVAFSANLMTLFIFYEMLTGKKPYHGDTVSALIFQHLHAPIPKLPMEHFELQPLLTKLMAKNPKDRFQNTAELFAALTNMGIAA